MHRVEISTVLERMERRVAGSFNPLIIPLIMSILAMMGLGFTTVKYFQDFTDQRDNNLPKIEAAVEEAKLKQKMVLEKDFLEREKLPLKTIVSPSQFGSVRLSFPKTWSAYISDSGKVEYDFYAHPNFVPAKDVRYALRATITNRPFAEEVKQYDTQLKKGEVRAGSIQAAGVTGTRFDGFLEKEVEGSIAIFPLRDKTLMVWTESKDFQKDFEAAMSNLSFSP